MGMTTSVIPMHSDGRRVSEHSAVLDHDASSMHTIVESPIGPLTLVARDGALAGVYMADHLHRPARSAFGRRVSAGFDEAAAQLEQYFAGELTEFTLHTGAAGSEFQRLVWGVVAAIPYGQTRSYSKVAEAIGRPDRLRAVAAAIGRNPLTVVVPCHRVIGADGRLTGFAGGLDRKRLLLERQGLSSPRPDCLF
jgi:methylated-DNA-[protein]-cysteine S-methyltransferase